MAGAAAPVQTAARDVPSLVLRASIKPGSVNVEKRTVDVIFTTGARVLRGGFWEEPFYEELSLDPAHVRMDRLNNGAPLLNNHNSWRGLESVLGVVERGWLEAKIGLCTVRFSARADVEPIFRDVVDGIIQNVSVGYRVHKFEKVEGGEGKIPVMRAVDWEPYEVSPVPMGADDGAGFRSADPKTTNRCEFVFTRAQEGQMTPTQTPATVPAVVAAPAADAARTAELAAAAEVARQEERVRAEGIQRVVRAAKLDTAFADKLVKDGSSLDKAREAVLEELAKRDDQTTTTQHNRMEIGEDATQKFMRGAMAWLFMRSGLVVERAVNAKVKGFDKIELDPGEFRGASIADLARAFLGTRGIAVTSMDRMRIVQQALSYRANGAQTTSDFAVLLQNVLHKTLDAAYATTPDTWRRFCKQGMVSDFRDHHRFKNGSFTVLDTLNEAGEFKNKAIPDGEKKSISVTTVGNIIALTRQVIVNDDMGAFTGLAERLGRAAALTIESSVYTKLLLNAGLGPTQADGQPFFHDANRKNVNTVGSALGVAGLDADRVVMGSQKDVSNNETLELRPKVLLVPLGLGGEAKVVNAMEFDDTSNKFQKPNKVRGLFSDIVDTTRLTGTRRYLFADPMTANAIEVAFLEGESGPVLESREGWRTDGTEWKVRLDFGTAFIDHRGAVTNPGV